MLLPLGSEEEDALDLEWDWVPVTSLCDIVDVGLAEPCRAFRTYLHALAPWDQATLAFTTDCRLIVGVSVDDPFGLPGPRKEASALMRDLVQLVDGERGWVVAEDAPPLDPERDRPWEQPSVIEHRVG